MQIYHLSASLNECRNVNESSLHATDREIRAGTGHLEWRRTKARRRAPLGSTLETSRYLLRARAAVAAARRSQTDKAAAWAAAQLVPMAIQPPSPLGASVPYHRGRGTCHRGRSTRDAHSAFIHIYSARVGDVRMNRKSNIGAMMIKENGPFYLYDFFLYTRILFYKGHPMRADIKIYRYFRAIRYQTQKK